MSKKLLFGKGLIVSRKSIQIGTVLHELGHLLGLVHEQMRSDRDQHIVVNMDNVRNFYRHNFYILQTIDNTKFDYGSIMHYGVQVCNQRAVAARHVCGVVTFNLKASFDVLFVRLSKTGRLMGSPVASWCLGWLVGSV